MIHGAAAVVAAAAALAAPGQVTFLDEAFDYDRERPAAGSWLGNVSPGRIPDTWASLTLGPRPDGWSGKITVVGAMAIDAECNAIRTDGPSVTFNVPALPGQPRFEGRIGPDGQRLSGAITYADGTQPGSFELARTPRPLDLPGPLAFRGQLVSQFGKLDIALVFARTPGGNWVGHVDVPPQGLLAFPLLNVRRDGDRFTADMAVAPVGASIDAGLEGGGARLSGRFRQGPFDLEINLERALDYAPQSVRRPQNPVAPFPYEERLVAINHPAGHVLAGTLALPRAAASTWGAGFPGAVLISGSGPQDRDETIFGHKPFLVIADYLARHGIAVLRCDDRGTGGSTGSADEATSQDLATDVVAEFEFLCALPEVDGDHVGLIGHSEGGVIAPMVAQDHPQVAFIVLLAGPGVPGDDLLRVQLRLILEAAGAAPQKIDELAAQQDEILKLMRLGVPDQELRDALRPVLEAQLAATMGLEADGLAQAVDLQLEQAASPWMRYFVRYDPRPALGRVHCPVLALNGTLDLQVWHEQNLPEIEKALRVAGGDLTARRCQGLNHLFQPATTGSPAEYAAIETTFDEGVLRDIVEWIHRKTGTGPGAEP